jgi:hypothetical protein
MLTLRRTNKMRLFISVIASAAMFFAASVAGAAVTFSAVASSGSGNALSALEPGDVVTVDITLRSDGEGTLAVGAAASGYDRNVVSFDSGQAASAVMVQVCIPAVGCFGGIGNVAANLPLAEAVDATAGPFVQFLTAVSLTSNTFTGASDPGVVTGVAGDAQFRLIFNADAAGVTQLNIGAFPEFGNAVVLAGGGDGVSNNTVVNLTVIPEPGTALLMGLGLAGLAAAGRRE